MEQSSEKDFSYIPFIMLVLALYVGYQSIFPKEPASKVYPIDPSQQTLSLKDTLYSSTAIASPINPSWSAMTPASRPMFTKSLPSLRYVSKQKPHLPSSPPEVVPTEEVVKNMLDQGENLKEIAKQTGLQVKQLKRIKREKKSEERRAKKQRKLAALVKK
jgi:hypothetical protein